MIANSGPIKKKKGGMRVKGREGVVKTEEKGVIQILVFKMEPRKARSF